MSPELIGDIACRRVRGAVGRVDSAAPVRGLLKTAAALACALWILSCSSDNSEGDSAESTTTTEAAPDISGTWQVSAVVVETDGPSISVGADFLSEEAGVGVTCQEDGECVTSTGFTIFQPLGGGLYAITGSFPEDCVDLDTGEVVVPDAYEITREGLANVTASRAGQATEMQTRHTGVSTVAVTAAAAGCDDATATVVTEATWVR